MNNLLRCVLLFIFVHISTCSCFEFNHLTKVDLQTKYNKIIWVQKFKNYRERCQWDVQFWRLFFYITNLDISLYILYTSFNVVKCIRYGNLKKIKPNEDFTNKNNDKIIIAPNISWYLIINLLKSYMMANSVNLSSVYLRC